MNFKRILLWSFILIFFSVLLILYGTLNPEENPYFPKCPFLLITGYKCPGCGSQRAIHCLLNFDIVSAFRENALMMISIPYILGGIFFDTIKVPGKKTLKWRKILYGRNAIILILVIIFAFWILRNLIH